MLLHFATLTVAKRALQWVASPPLDPSLAAVALLPRLGQRLLSGGWPHCVKPPTPDKGILSVESSRVKYTRDARP